MKRLINATKPFPGDTKGGVEVKHCGRQCVKKHRSGTGHAMLQGTPSTIGTHVSSGCIRLTNQDVADFNSRVNVGAKVIVLPMERRADNLRERS